MHWPATVASFRTWRGSRDYIAWDPEPDSFDINIQFGTEGHDRPALIAVQLTAPAPKNAQGIDRSGELGNQLRISKFALKMRDFCPKLANSSHHQGI